MPEDAAPLESALHDAERELKDTLEEACRTDPLHADTGELIRIEEILSIASDAAKRAVSVRRKLRQHRSTPAQELTRTAEERLAQEQPAHRTFTDSDGRHWAVWSVHPEERSSRRSQLRGSYSSGWLAFESTEEKRRLSPIPDEWEALADVELETLCRRAEPARKK